MKLIYPMLRITRMSSVALATYQVTDKPVLSAGSAILTEVCTAIVEVTRITPYIGNIILMIVLFPTLYSIYTEIVLFKFQSSHKTELKYIMMILCLQIHLAFVG